MNASSSILSSNTASGLQGGGIYNVGGTLTVSQSRFSDDGQ
jgi:predicted outer membrane repeat protein